jgi:uncharacterized protein with HEPN domain
MKKIISECKDIIRYTNEVGEKGLLENDVYQKATAMSLLNIGEHTNALTRELWTEYKDIQWQKIVDLRNIVAHGYGELRMELVWNLSQKEVPALMEQLEDLLK